MGEGFSRALPQHRPLLQEGPNKDMAAVVLKSEIRSMLMRMHMRIE